MDIAITMHFSNNKELVLENYSTLDISRKGREFNANATNTSPNLAFNDLFTEIQGYLGKDETFSVTVARGERRATFDRIVERQYTQAQQPPKKLFTRKETALYMQISEKTLDRIMKNKSFYPAARIGFGTGCIRINRDKLDKWIDEQDGSYKV